MNHFIHVIFLQIVSCQLQQARVQSYLSDQLADETTAKDAHTLEDTVQAAEVMEVSQFYFISFIAVLKSPSTEIVSCSPTSSFSKIHGGR